MAITYNALINLSYVFRYNGAYSANLAEETVFDYFDDDASVDDAIYFAARYSASHSLKWSGIRVYIGTAFAATSATFVWEYYNGVSWEILAVTDGTGNWINLGEQTVVFIPPADWVDNTVNGKKRCWVRCRIDAINTPTEGGGNSTQVVQVGNNTIVVTGFTADTPCNFTDLHNANVAGGWGVVSLQGTTQFLVNCGIQVGDGVTSTHFTDINKQITSLDNVGTVIWATSKATLTLGELIDAGIYSTANGCDFINLETAGYPNIVAGAGASINDALVRLYSCRFLGLGGASVRVGFARQARLYNCVFGKNTSCYYLYYSYMYNLSLEKSDFLGGYDQIVNPQLCNLISVRDRSRGIHGNNLTIYGLTLKNCTFVANIPGGWTGYIKLYNPDFDVWHFGWPASGGQTVYRFHSLTLVVQDVTMSPVIGATVTIVDVDGDAITGSPFTTDGNGLVAEQYLLHGTYFRTGGDVIGSKSPYTITISKAGYATKTIVYEMDQERDEIETLELYDATYVTDLTGTMVSMDELAGTMVSVDELTGTIEVCT